MLTKRDNLMETICGGNPDRFVNQFEAFAMVKGAPFDRRNPSPRHGEVNVVNAWGITRSWVAGTPGAFPVHDPEHIVCKDVTEWKRQVVFPKVSYPDSEWDEYRAAMAQVDRKEQLAVANVGTGLFELCHYLMEIQNCLMAFYEEPESMQELIDALVDWHMSYAEQICHHVRPDAWRY